MGSIKRIWLTPKVWLLHQYVTNGRVDPSPNGSRQPYRPNEYAVQWLRGPGRTSSHQPDCIGPPMNGSRNSDYLTRRQVFGDILRLFPESPFGRSGLSATASPQTFFSGSVIYVPGPQPVSLSAFKLTDLSRRWSEILPFLKTRGYSLFKGCPEVRRSTP
jgi:hypothetical protein